MTSSSVTTLSLSQKIPMTHFNIKSIEQSLLWRVKWVLWLLEYHSYHSWTMVYNYGIYSIPIITIWSTKSSTIYWPKLTKGGSTPPSSPSGKFSFSVWDQSSRVASWAFSLDQLCPPHPSGNLQHVAIERIRMDAQCLVLQFSLKDLELYHLCGFPHSPVWIARSWSLGKKTQQDTSQNMPPKKTGSSSHNCDFPRAKKKQGNPAGQK